MTDELTEDERELLRLVGEAAKAWEGHGDGSGAESAVLAHYRKAKLDVALRATNSTSFVFASSPTVPVYAAADGSLWVEDPDGTHGWCSVDPGGQDYGTAFSPRDWGEECALVTEYHGLVAYKNRVLRRYRRVEKK